MHTLLNVERPSFIGLNSSYFTMSYGLFFTIFAFMYHTGKFWVWQRKPCRYWLALLVSWNVKDRAKLTFILLWKGLKQLGMTSIAKSMRLRAISNVRSWFIEKKYLIKVYQQPQKPLSGSNQIWATTSDKKDTSHWPQLSPNPRARRLSKKLTYSKRWKLFIYVKIVK